MDLNDADTRALRQAGLFALQSGDPATARSRLEGAVAAGQADVVVWVALAMACRALDDQQAMLAALDHALDTDPYNLHALIMKGDYLASTGAGRAAVQLYDVAVTLASRAKELPPGLADVVRRAGSERDRINADIEAHILRRLEEAGYDEASSSRRFTQSIELLTGRRQRYVQEPRAYYFPELPQIQFFSREWFPWLEEIEAATDDIAAELSPLLGDERGFVPYVQRDPAVPALDRHSLLDSRDWSAFFLWRDGALVRENAERCPCTIAALERAPLARIPGRAPMALFSVLRPGTRIEPHTGFINTRLICHLPLLVPPDCGLRVGNEVRHWERGKALVFDDTIEHEAWNSSDRTRVVLIFDIWRPELSGEERALVTSLMEAVDSYGDSPPPRWEG